MTVKELASSCACLLQADDIASAIEEGADDPDVKTLVASIELALSEINSSGFPLVEKQTLTAVDGIIPFSAFASPPAGVIAVKREGKPAAFSMTPFGIKTEYDGAYAVEYSVFTEQKKLGDKITLPPLIGRDLAMYLAARNFCLITGRTDEAAVWDQRYEQEMEKKRIARRATLPARRW